MKKTLVAALTVATVAGSLVTATPPAKAGDNIGAGIAAGLTRIGLYKDKIDGKAGMQTRAALGAYQKSAGLKVDCWPSEEVLRSIQAAR